MHTVVRSYSGKGGKELFDVLEKNKADVEKTIRSVKGLVSYSLVRTADGGFSVTVCDDKAGTEESFKEPGTGSRRTPPAPGHPPRRYLRIGYPSLEVALPAAASFAMLFDTHIKGRMGSPTSPLRPAA